MPRLVGFPRRSDGAAEVILDGTAYRARDLREEDQPSFALTSKARSWNVYDTAGGRRQLTVAEIGALQGFRLDYPWHGKRNARRATDRQRRPATHGGGPPRHPHQRPDGPERSNIMKAADIVVGREYAVAWVSRNETEQDVVRKAARVVVQSPPKGTHVRVATMSPDGQVTGHVTDVRVREVREEWETFKDKVTYWQNHARDLICERNATAEREEAARQRIAGMGVFDPEGPLRYRLSDLDHQKVRAHGDGSGVAQVEVGLRWSVLEEALNKAYSQGYTDADNGKDAARGEHS